MTTTESNPESYIGRICVCDRGIVGRVTGIRTVKESNQKTGNTHIGIVFVGERLSDGTPWQSKYPYLMDESESK